MHVTGAVVGRADLIPAFLPYGDEGAWTLAKSSRHGFDAGGLERGTYLVALVPNDDGGDSADCVLLPGVEITGLGAERKDFRMPQARLKGRLVMAMASGDELRVLAVPKGVTGFAQELLASAKAATTFGRPVDPADGQFVLPNLAPGAHRLELRRSGSAEVLATLDVEVGGSMQLTDWVVDSRPSRGEPETVR